MERTLDAGTYYVRVHSYQTVGGYTLHLSDLSAASDDDHGNTLSSATLVSLPSSTPGTIDPGEDEDYFRFEVPADGTVVIESSGGLDVIGTLLGADGNQVAQDDDRGEGFNFRMEQTLLAGLYYVRVHSFWAESGAYTLHLRTAGDDGQAPPATTAATHVPLLRIALPSTTSGTIDPGNDTDQFRFTLPTRCVVAMESTGGYALYLRGGASTDGGDALRISTPTGSSVESSSRCPWQANQYIVLT